MPQRKKLPHETPHWVEDGAVFFITICTDLRGADQLCRPNVAKLIFESIEYNRARGIWWPYLVLLMPDHLHALMSFAVEPGMKKALFDWKHYSSRMHGIRWQRDFFDHRLRDDDNFDEKAAYIRANPVRAGLVGRPEDWPYVREWPTRISFEHR